MLAKILPFYVILASIFSVRKNRLGLAFMPSVSRLVGTMTISSAFWMGLIRCDCPELLIQGLDRITEAIATILPGRAEEFATYMPPSPIQRHPKIPLPESNRIANL
jgi:hypothetical protein